MNCFPRGTLPSSTARVLVFISFLIAPRPPPPLNAVSKAVPAEGMGRAPSAGGQTRSGAAGGAGGLPQGLARPPLGGPPGAGGGSPASRRCQRPTAPPPPRPCGAKRVGVGRWQAGRPRRAEPARSAPPCLPSRPAGEGLPRRSLRPPAARQGPGLGAVLLPAPLPPPGGGTRVAPLPRPRICSAFSGPFPCSRAPTLERAARRWPRRRSPLAAPP